MMIIRLKLLSLLACVALSAHAGIGPDQIDKHQLVYGAGPSTQIVKLFFEQFSKRPEAAGSSFTVPERSTKHAGGIRASEKFLFGRTGRPLTEKEKRQDKFEIILGRVPIGFVTGREVKLPTLEFSDINSIFSEQIANWKELQGPDAPVELIGREPTEAVLSTLSTRFPSLKEAKYRHVLKRDHAVANLINSPAGKYAIGFGALSNFHGMNIVELQGPPLGLGVGLVVEGKNMASDLVKAVEAYAHSAEWRRHTETAGYLSPGYSN